MNRDVRARGVQRARDHGADPLRGARDERPAAVEIQWAFNAGHAAPKSCGRNVRLHYRPQDPGRAMAAPLDLPAPSPAALAVSAELTRVIRAEIRSAGGWLDFARYMELALYAPGLGYYSAGSTKLGPSGDFVTAPELSALLGRALARTLRAELAEIAAPVILELGAGSGALAAQILDALADRKPELSDPRAERRPAREAGPRARALCRPRLVARSLTASDSVHAIVANEVLDALPVSRFAKRGRTRRSARRRRARRWIRVGRRARACRALGRGRRARARARRAASGRLRERGCAAAARVDRERRGRARPRLHAARRLRARAPRVLPSAALVGHVDLPLSPSRPRRSFSLPGPPGPERVGRFQRLRRRGARGGARGRRLHDASAVLARDARGRAAARPARMPRRCASAAR